MNTFTRWDTDRFVSYPVKDILVFYGENTPETNATGRKMLGDAGCTFFEEHREFDIRSDQMILMIKGYRLGEAIT